MHSSKTLVAVLTFFFAAPVFAAPAQAPALPVHIELSHQLDEDRTVRLESLIDNFNSHQKDVQLKMVRRLEGDAPKQINLVTREGYARFLANKTYFRPLYEVMHEAKEPLDTGKFSPELLSNLVDSKNRMLALPVAFSTPVLYINKTVFRKAGLNPDLPPKTWFEVQQAAGKLVDSGSQCAFTTSWPAWVHIDNLSAWNAGEVSDAKGNLAFNGLLQVKHLAMLSTWSKSKSYFLYFGRRDEADRRFVNGECAMLTSASSLYVTLSENKALEVGVSALPYHDDVRGAPQNTLADGASLWVGSGLKPAETKAVAKFVSYVLGPEVQINLTLAGGYLPMTPVARAAASSKLLKTDLAALQVAYAELQGRTSEPVLRVAQIEPVRVIIEDELEAVLINKKPAKEALDVAVQRANALKIPAPAAKGKKHSR